MSNIVDRDLFDEPLLFITERNKENLYTKNYTTDGLPFYVPPKGKNANEMYRLWESLFLPIKKEEFNNPEGNYFFGFRYLFAISEERTVSLDSAPPESSITSLVFKFEVTRIRYIPKGVKTMVINKSYDSLLPTQIFPMQLPTIFVPQAIDTQISEIIKNFSNYYVDKHI